ncbi:alpha/beta fold hydrolase [Paraburkholderia sp. HD33-4]|uniref:alpha/beta fold hydrolase n=1 Tax=Paraburkholderia sp. HD33-4 TaxID=2883242 RepID=UPI001F27874D|nr:alpha/beta hydrolase family protein [Paraburkholderia sp. HD33-4]
MQTDMEKVAGDMADEGSEKTFVLVHGAYHGAWCWKSVAKRLRSLNHNVYTPTLTGLGERSHLLGANPSLDTFIEDVAQVLRYEDLHDVVLVGHSFAGSVISALADRMPERISHLVYLDAQVLQSGQAPVDTAVPEIIEIYKQRAQASGGVSIPPGSPESFGVTDPKMAEWVKTKVTPHPYRTYFDKLLLKHPVGNGLPATYIACTQPLHRNTAHSREVAKGMKGWKYKEIATGHDAMITQPEELVILLLEVAGS